MGRSGSTLLQEMLNSHPKIIAPPESFFVLLLKTKYEHITYWNLKTKKSFVNDLYTDRSIRLTWKIPKDLVSQTLANASENLTFKDMCNLVRSCYRPAKEALLYCDKNPIYSIFLDAVMETDPSAKVIHLIRDPRGVACGQITTFKRKDALALGYMWRIYNQSIERIIRKRDLTYLKVYYEDLINKTEETLRNICTFSGLKYNENMMSYSNSIRTDFENQPDIYRDKHKSIQQPIDIKIAEKWKTLLSDFQIDKIAYGSHQLARRYGYDITVQNTSYIRKIRFLISSLKLQSILLLLKIYFTIPFICRKYILKLRSALYDKNYR